MARWSSKEIRTALRKIDTLINSSESHESTDDMSSVVQEQKALLQELTTWFKASEDKRKELKKINKCLVAQNQELRSLLNTEYEKRTQIQQKYDSLHNHNSIWNIIEEQPGTAEDEGGFRASADNITPVTSLVQQETQTESFNFPEPEMQRLQEDMQELTELLANRQRTWDKIAEREREQRAIIFRARQELEKLHLSIDNMETELHNQP